MILAIDPGNTESGFCFIDKDTIRPLNFGKVDNALLKGRVLTNKADVVAIEMVASYGMPVGIEVFETCVWIGRFLEAAFTGGKKVDLITRGEVKMHLCHSMRANDATIKQALVDRFAKGQRNYGKGTKKEPGFFYGFKSDIWSAFALGVTYIDSHPDMGREEKCHGIRY